MLLIKSDNFNKQLINYYILPDEYVGIYIHIRQPWFSTCAGNFPRNFKCHLYNIIIPRKYNGLNSLYRINI